MKILQKNLWQRKKTLMKFRFFINVGALGKFRLQKRWNKAERKIAEGMLKRNEWKESFDNKNKPDFVYLPKQLKR